jgi:hypothetical protein
MIDKHSDELRLCKDCRFYAPFHLTAFAVRWYRVCIHSYNFLSASPYNLRGREDLCGPKALWFEPRAKEEAEKGETSDQYQC